MNVRCNALASGRVPQLQLEETSGFGCGRLDDQARSALERSHDHRVEGGENGAVDPRPGLDDLCAEHRSCKQDRRGSGIDREVRSEEHTSELQSLMRISYAVFC